ncbi:MAG: hypothetical protein GYB53_03740 [Rhodobacteraceae bacterium]|nr:hypothetical protein [Paracoccaceae bacterium]
MPRAQWLLVALLSLFSALALPRLQVEADMNAAISSPALIDDSAGPMVDAWLDPPVVLLATWRAEKLDGFATALSDLVFELQLEDRADGVVSAFSLLEPESGMSPLDAAAEGRAGTEAALRQVRDMPFGPQFISRDLRASVVLISGQAEDLAGLGGRYQACDTGDDLCLREIGSAAIEDSITTQLRLDNAYLPFLSGLISAAIVAFWYRSLGTAVLLMIPPSFGLMWFFGAMAAAGVPLDMFNSLVPPVVLTLGLADMLHMKRAGETLDPDAGAAALRRKVLLPITVTSLTTALAFASMAFEDSAALRRLAFCGASGITLLWLSVVLLGPAVTLHRNAGRRAAPAGRQLSGRLLSLAQGALGRPRAILGAGCVAFGLGATAVLLTAPNFEFQENLPRGSVAEAVSEAMDAGLAMAPLFVLLADADAEEEQAAIRTLYGTAPPDASALGALRTERGGLVLPLPVPTDMTARDLRTLEERLRADLPEGVTAQVTGYPLSVANTILPTIARLQLVQLSCFLLLAATIGVAMRSLRVGVITLLTNALPLMAIYVAMALDPGWITVSATVAMIIASGIVADDTVHMLWASRDGDRLDLRQGLRRTLEPITLTTLCLVSAFAVVGLSGLPGLQLLAMLMVLALVVAWLADVLLLPASFDIGGTR